MTVRVYVEGGGDATSKRQFRRGLSKLFEKTELKGRMPRFVCCGGRDAAYGDFRTALMRARDNEFVVLLVDSEDPVNTSAGSWSHLKSRDGWARPAGATDDHAHLMVQCMEAWFLADRDTLATYFGTEFNANALPRRKDVENIPKADVFSGLKNATRHSNKGEYSKGNHSFDILGSLDPVAVRACSPSADRLFDTLFTKAGA